jgi:hypothetical protein
VAAAASGRYSNVGGFRNTIDAGAKLLLVQLRAA